MKPDYWGVRTRLGGTRACAAMPREEIGREGSSDTRTGSQEGSAHASDPGTASYLPMRLLCHPRY
eukprot:1472113-Rhodomonas_salina.4